MNKCIKIKHLKNNKIYIKGLQNDHETFNKKFNASPSEAGKPRSKNRIGRTTK